MIFRKFVNSIGWQALNVAGQSLLQLLYLAILSRLVSKEAFGLIALANVVIGLVEVFAQVGIGPALIQRKTVTQAHLNVAFWTSCLLGLAFTGALYGTADFVADFFREPKLVPVLKVIGLSFLFSALAMVPRSLIQRDLEFKKLFFANIIAIAIGNLGIGLYFALEEFEVWALVYALLAQQLVLMLACWMLHPAKIGFSWSNAAFKDMLGYGTGQSLAQVFNFAAVSIDRAIIGRYMSVAAAGLYDRAAYIINLPVIILGKFTDTVVFAGMSRIQDKADYLKSGFSTGAELIALLTMPTAALLYFAADEVVLILLGPDWTEAIPIFQILLGALVLRAATKIEEPVLRATGRVYWLSAAKLLFLICVAAATMIGVKYGATGVACGYLIALALQFVALTAMAISTLKIGLVSYLRLWLSGFVLALVTGAVGFAIDYILPNGIPATIRFAIIVLPVVIVALAILWIKPTLLGADTRTMLGKVLNQTPLPQRIKNRFSQPS